MPNEKFDLSKEDARLRISLEENKQTINRQINRYKKEIIRLRMNPETRGNQIISDTNSYIGVYSIKPNIFELKVVYDNTIILETAGNVKAICLELKSLKEDAEKERARRKRIQDKNKNLKI